MPPKGWKRKDKVVGYDEQAIGEPIVEKEEPVTYATAHNEKVDMMNAIAARIFEGQSVDLPMKERERRINNALVDKGYEYLIDKLVLPNG